MSLLAEAIRKSGRKGPRCSFSLLYETLDPEHQDDLDACLADDDITSTAIARGLGTIGSNIASSTVQRHRRGECGCGRAA